MAPGRPFGGGSPGGGAGGDPAAPPSPASIPPAPAAPAPDEEWPDPIPLAAVAPPSFPLGIFAGWLREYVAALATETQTPPDMAAMLALAALAVCGGRRARIRVRPNWTEPLCLFVLVVARAGARKSGVFAAVTQVVRRYEREENARLAPAIREGESQRRMLEQRLRKAELAAANAPRPLDPAPALALTEQLANLRIPTPLTLVEGDITPEALGVSLAEQQGTLAVMAPEGGLLATITGAQYSERSGLNLDAVLNGHAGDDIKVRRVGRPPLYIEDPALTLALTVQPSVLEGLAATPDYRGRGLLARFLYAMPADLQGARDVNAPPMPPAVRAHYDRMIRGLLDLAPAQGPDGQPCRHELRLTTQAHEALTAFMAWLEPQLAQDGALGGDDAWGSKLAGAVARIAGLLHLTYYRSGAVLPLAVAEETMLNAITLAREYLIPHVRAALGAMGADPAREEAGHILRWIERGRKAAFSRRDLCRDLTARFAQPSDADPALALLCELGYLREREREHRGGRRPGACYEAHPRLLARN